MDRPKRTGKVLEYAIFRGNHIIVYEYSYRKNKLVKNPKYDEHKIMLARMPSALVLYRREYDLKEEIKPRMQKTFINQRK